MTVMLGLSALMSLALVAIVALGVEDDRSWKARQPRVIQVKVPIVFVDSAYPPRQPLPPWGQWVAG